MDTIDVLTGQHVTIKYTPANIAQRMFALLLDFLFIFAYELALFFIFFILLVADSTAAYIAFGILSLPAVCYPVLFESLFHGQTPGKIILKIRVTNVDGSAPAFVSYFLRWLLFYIDMIPYGGLGALLIVFTKNHQRLGDLAAGTTVVNLNLSISKQELNDLFYEAEPDYKAVFPQAALLTGGQIRFITELLETFSDESMENDSMEELADKIKQKLNIETTLTDRAFLETIVKDYRYYDMLGI
jgi:uncharacterized RDD family membrane protein YckC